MEQKYIVAIDGGTSNTRLHLLQDGEIIETSYVKLGATSEATGDVSLEGAIKEAVADWVGKGYEIECFLASGMMTSNIGLMSMPHMESPFDPSHLTLKPIFFPAVHPAPFYFVSGVKFYQNGLADSDLIKGEETEIYGMLTPDDMEKNILVIHFGTHNKAMLIQQGKIVNSVTTISGELLSAITKNTILKSSVPEFEDFEMDEEYVKKGYEYAVNFGFTRCLFLGRAGDILFSLSKNQILSFIYGAIVQSDLQAFKKLLVESVQKIVLYGRDTFVQAIEICLPDFAGDIPPISKISYEESELLSAKGLYYIYKKQQKI